LSAISTRLRGAEDGTTKSTIKTRTMTFSSRHHVVIGDGASAAAFAEMAPLGPGDRLTVIGRDTASLGRGLAYGDHPLDAPWRYAYLLNSPSAAVLPAFAEDLEARWSDLAERMAGRRPDWLGFGAEHIAAGDYAALFAPRAIFGDYLSRLVRDGLERHRAAGVQVTLIDDEVTGLDHDGSGFTVHRAKGAPLSASHVDLAPGTPAMDAFCADAGPAAFPMLYGNEAAIADRLRPGQLVICVGANAAMLDVLRFLQSVMDESAIRMIVISATGLRPEPLIWHRPRRPAVTPRITGPFDSCEALMAAVDVDITRLRRDDGATMSELRPGFKAWLTQERLSALLPDMAERRRVTHLLERRFRRGTHDSIADCARLTKTGQITDIIARAKDVRPSPLGAQVRVTNADGDTESLDAPVVINCAGPGTRLALDPLSESLVTRGWLGLAPDAAGVTTGPGLRAGPEGMRYLAPTVTEVGDTVAPFPLFDLGGLRDEVARANRLY
jgi:uncharacterized NAD(P)/FAD-binding protein YdhS